MIHLNKFPIVDPNAQSNAPRRKRPLPQEVVAKKLGDTRHKLPEFLSIEFRSTKEEDIEQPSKEEEEKNMEEEEKQTNENKEEEKEEKIPDYIEHKIEKGDSLINISFKYNVPVRIFFLFI